MKFVTALVTALIVLIFGYIVYGLYLSQFEMSPVPLKKESRNGIYDYRGIINIHSQLSIGQGHVLDVIKAAKENQLDFLIMTDLNLYEQATYQSNYSSGVLFLVEDKWSYSDSRVLQLFNKSDRLMRSAGQVQAQLSNLLTTRHKDDDSGLLILTHPLRPRYLWSGEYPIGLDGVEIINLKAIWEKTFLKNKARFLSFFLIYPFNEDLAWLQLWKLPQDEIDLWDRLNQKRPTYGYAGADADGNYWMSYSTLFSLVQTHILLKSELTGNFTNDQSKIYQALKNGHFYTSLDFIGSPEGFSWEHEGKNLKLNFPDLKDHPMEAIIYRSGEQWKTVNESTTIENPGPGSYRAVVRLKLKLPFPMGSKWYTWIFSNPIHIP